MSVFPILASQRAYPPAAGPSPSSLPFRLGARFVLRQRNRYLVEKEQRASPRGPAQKGPRAPIMIDTNIELRI
jgi:hypothetical protein